jgi:phosphatidylglycerol:prolipoprotein diacylglycerol transferase
MAGCCWGKPADLPWSVVFSNPEAITPHKHIPLHPVQLYHSFSNLLIFLIMFTVFTKYRNRPRGFLFTLFLLLYPVGRFITEAFRGDAARGFLFDTFSTSQFISLLVFTAGLIKLADILRSSRRPSGRRT